MTYIEIEVTGPKEDLHSGFWGGATHNPALALVEILGKLYNPDNTIAVPGFYDDVVSLTDDERAMIAKNALTEAQFKAATGVPGALGRCATTRSASGSPRGRRSTSTACGAARAAPARRRSSRQKAGAKLSSRLVGNQDPHKIFELLKSTSSRSRRPRSTCEVRLLTTGEPALIPFDLPEMQAAARAYEKGWGAHAGLHPGRRQHSRRRGHLPT